MHYSPRYVFPGTQRDYQGKVISDKNEPLPAATVRVKNNAAGVTADSTGVFMIIVPALPAKLEISSIGYENAEVIVNNDQDITVNMRLAENMLIPVTIGGGNFSSCRKEFAHHV